MIRFWAMHFGHPTPKRSVLYSNCSWIGGMDRGPLPKAIREQTPNSNLLVRALVQNAKI